MTRPAEQREVREEDLKRQLRDAEDKAEALETQLQAEFPRYARLTAERPLSADEVQALLRPEEALIAFLPGNQSTFIAVIQRGSVHAYRSQDGAGGARGGGQGAACEPRSPPREASAPTIWSVPAVCMGRCSAAVDGWLSGIQHPAGGPGRAAARVFPLGALVTSGAAPDADLETVGYLGNSVAIGGCCPHVAALRDLRAVAGRSNAPHPSSASPTRLRWRRQDRRSVSDAANLCRQGEPIDPAVLRGLPLLRESADEVKRIAAALGAGGDA